MTHDAPTTRDNIDAGYLPAAGEPTMAQIIAYVQAQEDFARDWDKTFEGRPSYFTQEFWYLLVGCQMAQWAGRPLSVGQACQKMKSGSNRTREERIKRACDDGYLMKEKAGEDGRAALVRPTAKLEAILHDHFVRTRQMFVDALKTS
ncbi:hypothetical protein AEAC466_14790 [Asticcacaulis sp. AC466]|uniref:hypothetical protein n=1 Tax=Asticcacaulis sp. AC466 TaxID=1282362 RepID=UPI0003C3AFE2|nr:hypothetical protein [Asticcacaulis sp. AC466]ESQ83127.1 hypothetical protein AEAC466_14790 [Asticcacaulis sp. AC466]